MNEFLNDIEFLEKLDKARVRTQYARITLLSFDEKPLKTIEGNITTGSLSVNGSSAVRRTINLTVLANEYNNDLESLSNDFSIDKKIKISIGLDNPLKGYEKYGKTIWFPCGVFLITSGSVSVSTSGQTISIQGRDKMCMLDGTVGGVFPASISFHELVVKDAFGNEIGYEYPTIYRIIYEVVSQYGNEIPDNIIISDIDETVKMAIRYMGSSPLYFNSNYSAFSYQYSSQFPNKISYGEDAGYKETEFTYPGELTLNAGDTVVQLLDKVKQTLGNFEYFYDVDGRFHFQEIKNYLNTGSPLAVTKADEAGDGELSSEVPVSAADYLKTYNNSKFLYSLTDLDTTTQINKSPKFENIKNDFYAWGVRKSVSGTEYPIRYHLAIDQKPDPYYTTQYMWEIRNAEGAIQRYICWPTMLKTDQVVANGNQLVMKPYIEYENKSKAELKTQGDENDPTVKIVENLTSLGLRGINELSAKPLREVMDAKAMAQMGALLDPGETATLIGAPCSEWREEVYRRALVAQTTISVADNYYDSELISEWRKLYYLDLNTLQMKWNSDVFNAPNKLDFWLDFIDEEAGIGEYSIGRIGRRTIVQTSSDLRSVYNKEVPDVIFVDSGRSDAYGRQYFQLTPQLMDMFSISTTGASCFDKIREMLYQNLNYNTTITITCLPKYYLEPNNIIYIKDEKRNIDGNYLITQFSLPLAYNGTMSITATQVLTRV